MKYFVSDEIREKTTKCNTGFSCLSDTRNDLCKVVSCLNDNIHFIICLNKNNCSYQQTLFERTYCNCPTRIAVYGTYKK